MEIVENLAEWRTTFRDGWLAHLDATGETNFKLYKRPRNVQGIPGPAIDLTQSRLILISTAGGYLRDEQEPFDAESLYGDYTLRTFPTATPLDRLAFAHTHYDRRFVEDDPQVMVPLRHLEDMVDEGRIGELATNVISFCGYQPDVGRVVDELIPAAMEIVRKEQAQAALLVPA